MILLGLLASQEQYSMQNLLEFVVEAEKADLHPSLRVITFILGGMTMDLVILHGFGWLQLPNVLRK
jgi:hypothetical protein